MGISFEALSGVLSMNVAPWKTSLNDAGGTLNTFKDKSQQAFQAVSTAASKVMATSEKLAQGILALSVAAATAGTGFVKMASNAEEAASKFDLVFTTMSEFTSNTLEAFGKAVGRSRFELREMAANVGALLNPLGLSQKQVALMSVGFTKLAVDLSSLHNLSEEQAMGAFKSALAGQSEPLRAFGIQLTEASIQQEAFRLKIASNADEVKGATRATALYSLVQQQASLAQGDALRTAGSFANTLRRVRGQALDAGTGIGTVLLPAATAMLNKLSDWFKPLQNIINANVKWATGEESKGRMIEATGFVMDLVAGKVQALYEAGQRLWLQTEPLRESFSELRDNLGWVGDKLTELWNLLPQGVRDFLVIGVTLKSISGLLLTVGNSLPIIGGLFTAVGGVIGAVFTPAALVIGAVVAAIAAVGYGLYSIYQNSEFVRTAFSTVVETISEGVDSIVQWLRDNAGPAFEYVSETVQGVSEWVGKLIDSGLKVLGEWWETEGENVRRTAEKWLDILQQVGAYIVEKLIAAWDLLTESFSAMLPVLKAGIILAWEKMLDLFGYFVQACEAVVDMLNGDFRRAFVFAGKTLSWFIEGLATMLDYVKSAAEWLPFFGEDLQKSIGSATDSMRAYSQALRDATKGTQEQLTVEEKAEAMRAAAARAQRERENAESKTHVVSVAPTVGTSGGGAAASSMPPEVAKAAGAGPAASAEKAAAAGPRAGAAVVADALMNAKAGEIQAFVKQQSAAIQQSMMIAKKELNAKPADMKLLAMLRDQTLKATRDIMYAQGASRQKAIENARAMQSQYEQAFESIEASASDKYQNVRQQQDKTAQNAEKAAKAGADAEIKANEQVKEAADRDASEGEAGAKSKDPKKQAASGVQGIANAVMQMSQQLGQFFTNAFNGLGVGVAQFNELLEATKNPLDKIDLLIQNASARLGAAEINSRFGGLNEVVALQAEVAGLKKQREQILGEEAADRKKAQEATFADWRQRREQAANAELEKQGGAFSSIVGVGAGTPVVMNVQVHDIRQAVDALNSELRRQGFNRDGRPGLVLEKRL